MDMPSLVKFDDLKDSPTIRMSLPGPIPIGTRLILNCYVQRKNGPRTEELKIQGEFRVQTSCLDASRAGRQLLTVSSTGIAPSWKAVKNPAPVRRKVPPARAPRTEVA